MRAVLVKVLKGKLSPKLFVLGGVFLAFGFIALGVWKPAFNAVVWSNLRLKKSNHFFYTKWKSNEEPTYSAFHLFNWTNPEETLAKKSKPKFVDIGPFVYRRRHLKADVIWNDNDTATYHIRHRYDFIPDLSALSDDVEITSVNPAAIILLKHFREETPTLPAEVSKLLQSTLFKYIERSVYITRPAKEFLFSGYRDVLLDTAWMLSRVYPSAVPNIPLRFAWLYKRNITASNYVNVYSGKSDENKLGLLHSYNFRQRLSSLPAPCSTVRGTLGDLWPHNAAEQDEQMIFIPEILSTLSLQKVGSSDMYGIDGVKFQSTELTFDNGAQVEANRCYCKENPCDQKFGVRNLTTLLHRPFYVSHPHFYAADSSYHTTIEGMNPDPKKHQSRVVLEKEFGAVLDRHIRLQMNVLLEPIGSIRKIGKLSQLPKIIVPAMWSDEYFEMTTEQQDKYKMTFKTTPIICYIIIIALFSTGISSMVAGFIIKCRGEINIDRKSYNIRT